MGGVGSHRKWQRVTSGREREVEKIGFFKKRPFSMIPSWNSSYIQESLKDKLNTENYQHQNWLILSKDKNPQTFSNRLHLKSPL